jgi:hypothetical protein
MGMILDVIEKGSSRRFPWIEILSNKWNYEDTTEKSCINGVLD